MVRLSDLQLKEVISVVDGRRLGFIIDLEIDVRSGKVHSMVLIDQEKKGSFLSKGEELLIPWNHILRIGADVILVREVSSESPLMLP